MKNKLRLHTNFIGIASWALFDFSNSAYVTVVSSFIFAPYFLHSVADSTIKGTRDWTWAIAIAGVIIAIIAPFLGATIDNLKSRKPSLAILSLINIIAVAMLFFTQPNSHWVWWALIFIVVAEVAFELMQIPYNGMLYSISPNRMIGRISGWGWGAGYVGGLIALAIALFVFVQGHWIPTENSLNIRAIMLFTAAWLAVFYVPIFIFTPDFCQAKISITEAFIKGVKDLKANFKHARSNRYIFIYLISHLIYIDGLNTIFSFIAIFAMGTYHLNMSQIILLAMVSNVSAALGAALISLADDWFGPKFTICFSLACVAVIGMAILSIDSLTLFWILTITGSIFVGPAQAASRSYMARIAPPHLSNELFGMFALSGRITAFLGPFLVGLFTDLFSSQRVGMVPPVILIIIGLVIMLWLPRHEVVAKAARD